MDVKLLVDCEWCVQSCESSEVSPADCLVETRTTVASVCHAARSVDETRSSRLGHLPANRTSTCRRVISSLDWRVAKIGSPPNLNSFLFSTSFFWCEVANTMRRETSYSFSIRFTNCCARKVGNPISGSH